MKAAKSTIILIYFIFIAAYTFAEKDSKGFELPVKLWAYSDVTWLSHTQYHVHLYLELRNDDRTIPVALQNLVVDTWKGTKPEKMNQLWYANRPPIVIQPNSKQIVAEKSFYVNAYKRSKYWIRWHKFKAQTDRGIFESNFIAMPYSANATEEAPNWIKPANSGQKLPLEPKP